MKNKQVEFNPYIYTLSKLYSLKLLAIKYPGFFFNTKHPVIILRASLFVVQRLMSLHRKSNVKIFLMFIVAENTGSVNIDKL